MEIVSEENTKLCTTTLAKLHLLLLSGKKNSRRVFWSANFLQELPGKTDYCWSRPLLFKEIWPLFYHSTQITSHIFQVVYWYACLSKVHGFIEHTANFFFREIFSYEMMVASLKDCIAFLIHVSLKLSIAETYFHCISHTSPSPSLSCSVYVFASNKFTGVHTRTGNMVVVYD